MLKHKTPMRRSGNLKRSPLKKTSKKYGKELRIYSVKRKAFLERHPVCSVGSVLTAAGLYEEAAECTYTATDVHHSHGRGLLVNAEAYFIPTCRQCHDWVHHHGGLARTLGLLK